MARGAGHRIMPAGRPHLALPVFGGNCRRGGPVVQILAGALSPSVHATALPAEGRVRRQGQPGRVPRSGEGSGGRQEGLQSSGRSRCWRVGLCFLFPIRLVELPMPGLSAQFDPYHKWLGIPPEEQPVHLYRLVGVAPFEPDREVIEGAIAQRLAFVESMQQGPHAALARELLAQLHAARSCLVDPVSRAIYDARLQRQLDAEQAQAEEGVTVEHAAPLELEERPAQEGVGSFNSQGPAAPCESTSISDAQRRKTRVMVVTLVGHVVAPVVGLFLGYLVLCSFGPQYDFLGLFGGGAPAKPSRTTVPRLVERSHSHPARPAAEPTDRPPAGPVSPVHAGAPVPQPTVDDAVSPDERPPSDAATNPVPDPAAPLPPEQPAAPVEGPPLVKQHVPDFEAQASVGVDVANKPAEQLLREAAAGDGAARAYVLLEAARLRAIESGDAELALRVVAALERRFDIDVLTVKLESLESLGKSASSAPACETVAHSALALIEVALLLDDRPAARRCAALAEAAAKKAGSSELEAEAARQATRLLP